MRVRFFMDCPEQQWYDRRLVQFNDTPDNPAPAPAFFLEHYRQAVLANMKGAGKVTVYDFDPEEDAQSMSVFESGEGKDVLEAYLSGKLGPDDGNDCVFTNRSSEKSPLSVDFHQLVSPSPAEVTTI